MTSDPVILALISKAMEADEEISQVQDDRGHVIEIERDPGVPGAKKLSYVGSAEDSVPTHWRFPASSEPSSLYPDGVPFLPGMAASVLRGEERLFVHWRDDFRCPEPDQLETLESSMPDEVRATLHKLRDGMKEGGEMDRSKLAEVSRILRELWTEDGMTEWVGSTASSDPDPRFVEGFEALAQACSDAGWTETEDREPQPFRAKSAAYTKAGRRRRIVLHTALGTSQLMLWEKDE